MVGDMSMLLALLAASSMTNAGPFSLTSVGFQTGATMSDTYEYAGMGCDGHDVSPPLHWSGAPAGTKSYALTVHDPDARAPGGWWHWVVFNIPASADGLKTAAGGGDFSTAPTGSVEGTTSFGKPGYGGPCPPVGSGVHHYIFTLYALDVAQLAGASKSTDGPQLTELLSKHTLGKATLIGLFSRS
jgi:Raf kinase inhibitor-like YbhB/YbcL family protein